MTNFLDDVGGRSRSVGSFEIASLGGVRAGSALEEKLSAAESRAAVSELLSWRTNFCRADRHAAREPVRSRLKNSQ